jgi:hypothetical protein
MVLALALAVAHAPLSALLQLSPAMPAAFHRDAAGWHVASLQCDLPRQRLVIHDAASYDPDDVGRAPATGVAWVQDKSTGASQALLESGTPVCREGRCTRDYRSGTTAYRITTRAPGKHLPTAGDVIITEAGGPPASVACRDVPRAVFACMTPGYSVFVAGETSGDLTYSAWTADNASPTPSLSLGQGSEEHDMGGKVFYRFNAGDVTYTIRTSRWVAEGIAPRAELVVRRGETVLALQQCQSYTILGYDRPW